MQNPKSKHRSEIFAKLNDFFPFNSLTLVANVVQIAKGKANTIWLPAFQNTLSMLAQNLSVWFCSKRRVLQLSRADCEVAGDGV